MIKIVKKIWGEELWIVNNELYCSKILKLKKGYRCSYHMHKIKDETFYILEGTVFMRHNDIGFYMTNKSDPIRILPGEYHSFAGVTDAKILEISTQHFDEDSYRKDKSGRW